MAFFVNCGNRLDDGAKFCSNCGQVVVPHKSADPGRKTVFDGNIHKCPNCGEVLPSFAAECPACGCEIRGRAATDSVYKLYRELNKSNTVSQKKFIIRNFPIPNSKEDIIEFMILASSNIIGEDDRDIYEAWLAKFEQAYQKSILLFRTDGDFAEIQQIYENCQSNISFEKQRKINKYAIDTVVRNIAVCMGVVLIFIASIVDRYGGNTSLIEITAYLILIFSACSLVKRGSSVIDYELGAGSGILTIVFSFFLYNGSLAEICGAVVLIIVAINYFISLFKSPK